jgi:acetyl esterase/lipase
MAESEQGRWSWTARKRWVSSRGLRVGAWCSLAVVTGWLVRAEGQRDERPSPLRIAANLVYRRSGGRSASLDLYAPTTFRPHGGWPAIIAIHGGGWRGGNKAEFGHSLARLAESGFVIAAVDYRLSRPGTPSWPDNVDDVRESVRWLRRHALEYGVDPNRIAALGASAGGHLAALLGTSADPTARVEAVIDFYGPTDLRALFAARQRTTTSLTLFLGGRPDEYPGRYDEASPIRQVSAGSAPMLLIHGTDDLLVPLDQSRMMDEALSQAGVPHRMIIVDHARHGFGLDPQGRDLVPEIRSFLESVWNRSPICGNSLSCR